MVAADANVVAGVDAGPALSHDDPAGAHDFAVEQLYAESLRVAVAAVTRRANAFLVSHCAPLFLGFFGFVGGRFVRCVSDRFALVDGCFDVFDVLDLFDFLNLRLGRRFGDRSAPALIAQ